MRTMAPQDLRPVVRIANWHDVPPNTVFDRTIPDLQFICIVSGRFRYRDANDDLSLSPGEVLCIEPGIHHVFAIAPGVRSGRISGFHAELAPGTGRAAGGYRLDPAPMRVTRPTDPTLVRELFRRCAEAWSGYARWRRPLTDAIALEILLRLAEHWSPAGAGADRATEAMVGWLRDHAALGGGRTGLARRFGRSPEAVNRHFRRVLGMTPTEVRNRERCRIAWERLPLHGASVAEAAAAAGFSDPFYFSRVFRRLYGHPPSRVHGRRP